MAQTTETDAISQAPQIIASASALPSAVSPAIPTAQKRKPFGKPFFTKENAQRIALAGQAMLRKKREDARLAAIAKAERDAALAALPKLSPRLQLVDEQISHMRKALDGELEPKERAALCLALDKLLDRERVLQGIPSPGTSRPQKQKLERIAPVVPLE